MKRLRMPPAKGNSKLKNSEDAKYAYTFSLPAGVTCPFALKCYAFVNEKGKIVRGPEMEYQCFGATSEVRSPSLREMVKKNFDLIRGAGLHNIDAMFRLIAKSIPADARRIRIHTTGGDYISSDYMKAWMKVARLYDDVTFYGYTKSLRYMVENKSDFPANFRLVASEGGVQDDLIERHNLVHAKVVFHPEEAEKLGLEIDHDDSLAIAADKTFALLLHGQQPAGSDAAAALRRMKKENVEYSYS